jgi:hypothetical protein
MCKAIKEWQTLPGDLPFLPSSMHNDRKRSG